VIGLAIAFLGASTLLLVLVGHALSHLDVAHARNHLKPVPIAPSACPYVALMHTTANNFQIAEPVLGFAFDQYGNALSWEQTRIRLDAALKSLEATIQASEQHFPVPIQQQLDLTLGAVREGAAQLPLARDRVDLMNRMAPIGEKGRQASGRASDLIGKQCGTTLGADNSTFLYPFGATTTTR
jgi:hypothetical protein